MAQNSEATNDKKSATYGEVKSEIGNLGLKINGGLVVSETRKDLQFPSHRRIPCSDKRRSCLPTELQKGTVFPRRVFLHICMLPAKAAFLFHAV